MDGPKAFPGPSYTRSGLPNGHDMGMTLRDYFASTMDRDEYGELSFRHLSNDAREILVGEKKPKPVNEGKDRSERVQLQIQHVSWELKVRAAIRFIWADAMLKARESDK